MVFSNTVLIFGSELVGSLYHPHTDGSFCFMYFISPCVLAQVEGGEKVWFKAVFQKLD